MPAGEKAPDRQDQRLFGRCVRLAFGDVNRWWDHDGVPVPVARNPLTDVLGLHDDQLEVLDALSEAVRKLAQDRRPARRRTDWNAVGLRNVQVIPGARTSLAISDQTVAQRPQRFDRV